MAVARGIRIGGGDLLTALAAALAVLLLGCSSPRADAAPYKVPQQIRLLLRLTDLPRGYQLNDGTPEFNLGGLRCAPLEPADPNPLLAQLLRRAPSGCMALYGRAYRVPGTAPAPLAVGSGVVNLPSAAAAEEALDLAPFLLSHAIGDEIPVEAPAPGVIGERTRLFRWSHGPLFADREEATAFLVWRWGTTVGAIFVAGGSAAANDGAALAFAQRQQRRFEAPEPFSLAELDDTEVPLDDPAIDVPIHWFGPRLPARPGLPALHLSDSATSPGAVSRPRVSLFYRSNPRAARAEGVLLNVYSAAQWKRLAARKNLPGTLGCGVTAKPIPLRRGRAVALHGGERRVGPCRGAPRSRNAPRSWGLRAHLGGAVVTAETIEDCATCAEPGRGAFNSFRGMRALARALKLRPKPAY